MMEEKIVEIVHKYVKDNQVIAIGSSFQGLQFLKKIAIKIEEEELNVKVVPSTIKQAAVINSFGLESSFIEEREIDLAIEFAERIDNELNYIKINSLSLIKDKMIARSADKLVIIGEENSLVKNLNGTIAFEISEFGWKRTLLELESLGFKARLKKVNEKNFKTETNNLMALVEVDNIYSLEDIDFQAKSIPGVLESGLFLGLAEEAIILKAKTGFESITIKK